MSDLLTRQENDRTWGLIKRVRGETHAHLHHCHIQIFKHYLNLKVLFCDFLALFGHLSDSTSNNDSLIIELNYLLNIITKFLFYIE